MRKKIITENMFHTINEKSLAFTMVFSSRRKSSISMQVKNETIFIQAPLYTPRLELYNLIQKQEKWILKRLSENEHKRGNALYDPNFSVEMIDDYRIKAQNKVSERMRVWQEIVGVKPTKIKITNALKRWGSCSADNVICFSWRIVLLPLELLDYIVVHELCHIVHKNHSNRFWKLVERVMPDYKQRDKALLTVDKLPFEINSDAFNLQSHVNEESLAD